MIMIYKRLTIILTIVLLFAGTALHAQKDIRIKRRNFKIDTKQGFKEAWDHIKNADDFFEEGIGFFDKAIEEYKKAYDYNPENAALNYKMGICYLSLRDNKEAINAFNKALAQNEDIAIDIFYLLARAYHLDYQFENAINNYQRCLEKDIIEELDKTSDEINVYIRQCSNAQELIKSPVRVNINNLGPNINSKYDDYGSIIHPNDSILYFTSRRKTEENDERWIGDNKFFSNIYRSYKKDGEWTKAEIVPKRLRSDDNEAIVEITQSPERIYVYNADKDNGDIYYYEMKRDKWRGPKNFTNKLNTNDKESAMCFSTDEREIYYVSNWEEQTCGKKDLFVIKKDNKGRWRDPANLGGLVNSWLNEEGVYINDVGDRIYFSSEGKNSMGGYDIFYSERDADGNWQKPVNIGYPVNTPYDDLLFRLIDETGKKAYFTSIRDDTYGRKDIYEVIFLGAEKDYFLMEEKSPLAWEAKPDSSLLFKTPEKLAIDTTLYLVGNILDSTNNEGIKGKIQLIDNDKNKIISTYLSDTLGNYTIKLPEKKKYGVEVTAKDYLFYADQIDLNKLEIKNDTIHKDFYLDKVEVGKKVVLENIYFETGKSKLKKESYEELGRVVELLKNNPSIKLEIAGHTDNVGSYITNKRLSKARAKSVVDYLISQGISRSRLKYEGYSFTKPIATNDTPEGRQKNRRVEFKILEK
jgi:outer membrane protein OmpA-like peptidoglycan-associated protein